MTYRSRTGGPAKAKLGTKAKSKRKLHHPPDPTARPSAASRQDISTSPLPPTTSGNGQLLEQILSNPSDPEILSLIHHALRPTLDSPDFVESVQRVKTLLYERKWLEVFSDPELIGVYAGRWTPSRALCYRHLFASLEEVSNLFVSSSVAVDESDEDEEDENEASLRDHLDTMSISAKRNGQKAATSSSINGNAEPREKRRRPRHILSLGGGASSELLAVAALIKGSMSRHSSIRQADHTANDTDGTADEGTTDNIPSDSDSEDDEDDVGGSNTKQTNGDAFEEPKAHDQPEQNGIHEPDLTHQPSSTSTIFDSSGETSWKWTGIDIGPWTSLVDSFRSSLSSQWNLESSNLDIKFHQIDILNSGLSPSTSPSLQPPKSLPELLTNDPPQFVTLLFTLTELLTQSRTSTIALLRQITALTKPGCLFLVVDSASDISDFELGGEGRRWPVYMVLDAVMGAVPASPGTKSSSSGIASAGKSDGIRSSSSGQATGKEVRFSNEHAQQREAAKWELLESSDSRWFRLTEDLGAGWPVKLENTRYWLRLFRRV